MRTTRRANASGEFEAINVRHVVIGDHQMNVGIGLENGQRLGTVFGNTHTEIVTLETAGKQRAGRSTVIDDQHMVAMVGQKATDRLHQHVDGEDIVLQHIVHDVHGEDLFAHAVLHGAGEHNHRNRKIDQIVKRLAIFGTRQVDIGDRQRDRLGGLLVKKLQFLEVTANFHIKTQHLFQG